MIITGVDTETTGLSQEDGHRIVEICFRTYNTDTQTLVNSYIQRINPQRSIDAKAQEVHGISLSDLSGKPTWKDCVEDIQAMMREADVMIAHNMKFDGPFIALELMRVGADVPPIEAFCTMENGRWATPNGKNPNLGELCFALGVDYTPEKAHSAEYDVDVMMKCLFKGMDRRFYTIPGLRDVPKAA